MTKSSKLSKLAAGLAPSESEPEAPKPAGAKAFVVYDATVDPNGEFEHEGRATIFAGECFLMFCPGLNVLDGPAYAKGQKHPLIAARVNADSLKSTDAELSGYTSLAARRKLAATTEQPEALEALLKYEMSLKVSAGRARRRDPKIVALLERKVASAVRAPVIDMSDLHTMARANAKVAQPEAV